MIVEKNTIKTEAIYNDDKSCKYLLKKEWDNKKSKAMVIMLQPCTQDDMILDMTTVLTMNNLKRLDYGSVNIVNAYPFISPKIQLGNIKTEDMAENQKVIFDTADKSDVVIIAWGKKGESNKKIDQELNAILKLLSVNNKEKMYILSSEDDGGCLHPLTPKVRGAWHLVKYD